MMDPRRRDGATEPPHATLMQVVQALVVVDDPLLDRRFHEAIAMHPNATMRQRLHDLPARVAEGARLTLRAGSEWEAATGGTILNDEFTRLAERFLLEAMLEAAQSQIRLKSFMAAHAPTREVRRLLDEALAIHHELPAAMRDAIASIDSAGGIREASIGAAVGQEDAARDLRSQVEASIRAMREARQRPRELVVSVNALRHLRDQGAIAKGARDIEGVPILLDLAWEGSQFALMSFDQATFEEVLSTE